MSLMVHPFRPSLVSFFFAAFLCASSSLRAQDFIVYDNLEQLQSRINRAGDTTLLLNFWATWCKPCVEELPAFDEMREYYGRQNVQVVLVSLDFKSEIERKLVPFLKQKQLKSEVAVLADREFNTWIPLIYDQWDGAIPATLLFKGTDRKFKLGKFENLEELKTFVLPFITDTGAQIIDQKRKCHDLSGGKK